MTAKGEDASWIFKFSIEHRDQPEVSQEMLDNFLIASNSWAEERGLRVLGNYYGESEFTGSNRERNEFLRREIKKTLSAAGEA